MTDKTDKDLSPAENSVNNELNNTEDKLLPDQTERSVEETDSPSAETKPRIRISHIIAAAGIIACAAFAGAAVVSDIGLSKDDSVRIYQDPVGEEVSSDTLHGDSSASGKNKGAKDSSAGGTSKASKTSAAKASKTTSKTTSRTTKKTTAKKHTVTAAPKTTSVPVASAETVTSTTAVTAEQFSYPEDINKASLECLVNVHGINRTAAEGIVFYREAHGRIHNYEELLEIFGIGERTLKVIREHFFISDEDHIPYTASGKDTSRAEITERSSVSDSSGSTAAPEPDSSKSEGTVIPPVTSSKDVTDTSPAEDDSSSQPDTTGDPDSSDIPEAQQMKTVCINEASAEELAEALLIKPELAEAIVELRTSIGAFVNDLELLYVEGFSKEMLVELRPYIEL